MTPKQIAAGIMLLALACLGMAVLTSCSAVIPLGSQSKYGAIQVAYIFPDITNTPSLK